MKTYRIAENKETLELTPWTDALGIEEIDSEDEAGTPALVCWLTRGEGQREFARKLVSALNALSKPTEAETVWDAARRRIEDFDCREAAGEDVSQEVRPRMPGGSDF